MSTANNSVAEVSTASSEATEGLEEDELSGATKLSASAARRLRRKRAGERNARAQAQVQSPGPSLKELRVQLKRGSVQLIKGHRVAVCNLFAEICVGMTRKQ